jgi:hypothetical protein
MVKVGVDIEVSDLLKPEYLQKLPAINAQIVDKSGLGADYLGWSDYFAHYDMKELARIEQVGQYIK